MRLLFIRSELSYFFPIIILVEYFLHYKNKGYGVRGSNKILLDSVRLTIGLSMVSTPESTVQPKHRNTSMVKVIIEFYVNRDFEDSNSHQNIHYIKKCIVACYRLLSCIPLH